jgi:hypothetical protein
MKLLYKPVGLLCGVIAGLVARRLFTALWGVLDRERPPDPAVRDVSFSQVVAAAALEAATLSATRVAVDRAGARAFEHLVGVWPGPREPERLDPRAK